MSGRLSPFITAQRRQFLITCGAAAVTALAGEPGAPSFLENSRDLDRLVDDYGALRQQFVEQHGMEGGLLANHKVAALYVWLLTKMPAEQLFLFGEDAPPELRRLAMMNMMNAVVLGVLYIDPETVDKTLQDDLEYCLLKEPPANLEWLCFSFHALCRLNGKPTNIQRA